MPQVPLAFSFCLALAAALFGTALLPQLKLSVFAPFLALLYRQKNFQSSLWIASLCGLILDLLSSELRLGVHALNCCLTTLVLFRQKKHFFEDKPLSLSLFTLLISIFSTVIQLVLMAIFGKALPLSLKLLATDLIIMPLVDAVYAFAWFSCPIMLYAHIQKTGWRAFCRLLAQKVGLYRVKSEESK